MGRRRPTVGEHNAMAVYLSSRGAYDLAISELKKARRLAPSSPVIHYNLGAAYFGKKELDQALSALKVALELEPHYIKAHLLLGFILEVQGLYEDSHRELTWVIERDPLSRSGQEAKAALINLQSKSHGAPQSPRPAGEPRRAKTRRKGSARIEEPPQAGGSSRSPHGKGKSSMKTKT
jgi:tetratricopeptide (TPR) repeat protein